MKLTRFQVNFVKIFGDVNIDEVNRQIVRTYAEQGQENASTMETKLAETRQRIQTTRQCSRQEMQWLHRENSKN